MSTIKTQNRLIDGAHLVVLGRSGITRDIIRFQTPPQTITDGKNADYNSKKVLGRSEPLRAYTGSDERSIQFELDYYWYQFGGQGNVGSWSFIENNINKLKSLVYPQYGGATRTGYMPAQKVLFFFGQLYQGVPCIVKSVNVQHKAPWVCPDTGFTTSSTGSAKKTQSASKSNTKSNDKTPGIESYGLGRNLSTPGVTSVSAAKAPTGSNVVPFQTTASIGLSVSYDYDDARGAEHIAYGLDGQNWQLNAIEKGIRGGLDMIMRMFHSGRG